MMMRTRRAVWLGVWIAAAAVGACDDDSTGPGSSEDPMAVIQADRTTVPAGDNFQTIVRLDASDSFDPDGGALNYSWQVPSGRFENGTTPLSPVIEVSFPGAAPYTVTLTVTSLLGGSDIATITIGLDP